MAGRRRDSSEKIRDPVGMKVARALELPVGTFHEMAHVEFTGNREAFVEGIRGVLEYDENIIRLNSNKLILRFIGRGLNIKSYNDDSMVIEGYIISFEFMPV